MYQNSPQELQMMDYCNEIQSFINFTTSILRNISGDCFRCLCMRCKNKKFIHQDVVTMHLLHKGFMEDYLCWYAHEELFIRNENTVKRMVGSTSSANNVHGVVNDNIYHYRNMVMDKIRMNQGNDSQYSIIKKKPNADATRFFDLLKDFHKLLWDGYTNHIKLSCCFY